MIFAFYSNKILYNGLKYTEIKNKENFILDDSDNNKFYVIFCNYNNVENINSCLKIKKKYLNI